MTELLMILLAVFFPPVAVGIKCGLGKDLLINIILCVLFYVPGIVHAIIVVMRK